jgi:type II secretory pathway component GspD/PulD (secretin)
MIESLIVASIAYAMNNPANPAWLPWLSKRQAVSVREVGPAIQSPTILVQRPELGIEISPRSSYLKPVAFTTGNVVGSVFNNIVPTVQPVTLSAQTNLSLMRTVKQIELDRSGGGAQSDIGVYLSKAEISETVYASIMAPMIPVVSQSDSTTKIAAQPFATPTFIGESKNVSLALSSTPLETVVSLISKQVGINIVLLAKPDQKVTINVKDMNLMEAIKHLAAISSLKVLKVKNTVVMAEETTLKSAYPREFEKEYGSAVGSSEPNTGKEPKAEPALPVKPKDVVRVLVTNFQSATQLALSLKDYLQARNVAIVALPNTLVPSIDSGSGVQGGNNGVTSGVLNTDRANNETGSRKVLLSGPQAEVEEAIRLIEQLDMPRKQVEITVTIHDVANEALKEAGVTWNFGSFTVSENTNNSMNFGTFSRSGTSFQATMKALEQNDNAKLLASPNVSVMDGMRGFILIGEKRQFPVVNGTTPTGQFIFSTQEQNIGIYLQVAADVASDGTITLAVKPQVSAIIGFLQLNGGSYPQISTRESQSTLSLKDGQTMLLGGLLRDEEIRNLEQVPLLSKIPLFGELFKRRRTEKRSSQLVISITPKIVN